jgi:hypothetical protein
MTMTSSIPLIPLSGAAAAVDRAHGSAVSRLPLRRHARDTGRMR